MKISIIGMGYVGLSLAVLLSQKNKVVVHDILEDKIDKINKRISPIKDKEIEEFLSTKKLDLYGSMDKQFVYNDSKYVVIATPTDYDEVLNQFDTTSIENVMEDISTYCSRAVIIIKSTVPVGYTERMKKRYKNQIIFSPEFLREGKALYDNLHPSRIILSEITDEAKQFANLLKNAALNESIPVLYTNSTEAEAIKLFSNTFLALRVSFFNELDSYAMSNGLSSKDIIEGVCLDPRIGSHYNNPSFGYGGYCLPKDTKQLLSNFENIPQKLITSVVESNITRKEFIATQIINKKAKKVGIFRLTMKLDSDNFRQSAIFGVIEYLKNAGVSILVYEPSLDPKNSFDLIVENDLCQFKKKSEIIIANRMSSELSDVNEKVFTRDIFGRD